MNEIRPCPFCGSDKVDAVLSLYSDVYLVMCPRCGAFGPKAHQGDHESIDQCEARAIRYWNGDIPADECAEWGEVLYE